MYLKEYFRLDIVGVRTTDGFKTTIRTIYTTLSESGSKDRFVTPYSIKVKTNAISADTRNFEKRFSNRFVGKM